MSKLKTILVDCDGPLANFSAGAMRTLGNITGIYLPTDKITTFGIIESPFFAEICNAAHMNPAQLKALFWADVKKPRWCAELPMVEGAREGIEALRGMAENVEVVTSPLGKCPTWVHERSEWLQENFGFHEHEIHFSHRKHRFIGDFLIDDKGSHCADFERETRQHAVLWDMPYNGHDLADHQGRAIQRCSGWVETAKWIENIRDLRDQRA